MSMDLSGFLFIVLVITTSLTMVVLIPVTVLTVLWLNNDKIQVTKAKKGQSLNLKIYKERKK